jgi:hypothetical protein
MIGKRCPSHVSLQQRECCTQEATKQRFVALGACGCQAVRQGGCKRRCLDKESTGLSGCDHVRHGKQQSMPCGWWACGEGFNISGGERSK